MTAERDVAYYEARQDHLGSVFDLRRVRAMKARGVSGLRCRDCGARYPLSWVGYACNAAHQDADTHDGEACGGELREVGRT